MNHAKLVLESLEKTASAGLVAAALEMATGAAVGGTLGIMSARAGRQGDPLGSSDVSGAVYGGVLGALAGTTAGRIMRSSAVQRGVADDSSLTSMAERISDLENLALYKKVKSTQFSALQTRDDLSRRHFGVGHQEIARQVNDERMQLHRQLSDAIGSFEDAKTSGDPTLLPKARNDLGKARDNLKAFDNGGLGQDFKKMQKDLDQYVKGTLESDRLHSEHLEADLAYQRSVLEQRQRQKLKEQKDRMRSGFFGMSF
jgi:hypothetical protein